MSGDPDPAVDMWTDTMGRDRELTYTLSDAANLRRLLAHRATAAGDGSDSAPYLPDDEA